ncbi:unnamed protein product, partial [Tetraodon nigroviridis]
MASDGEDVLAFEDREERKPTAVSFGFTKTISKFKPQSADASSNKDEKEYLTRIDKHLLQSSEKPKELIIPLIVKNRWNKQGQTEGNKEKTAQDSDSVDSQAVKELIEDSRRQLDQWQNGSQPEDVLNLNIPLLMQNKVPDGFEDGDHVKVDLRPESSAEADYEQVPVEAYGYAMIRGMGWKKSEGIGRTFKQNVTAVEHQVRPKGLGLGADRSLIKDLEPSKRKQPPKPGDERTQEEELVMAPGSCVLVESGPHKDKYGKIEGVYPDNARVVVKLAIGGKTVDISQYIVRLVGRKEYDRYSKDLSHFSKAEKVKEKEREKDAKRHEERERSDGHSSSEKDWRKEEKKRKHGDLSQDKHIPNKREKHLEKDTRKPAAPPSWLQRDLKVRFIDKDFKGGRYYNSKMLVEDVLTPTSCVCRTEEGRIVEDVQQDMLETVVPKSDSETIMVVLGEQRGQVGRILQRDKNKCRAMVQLDRYEEKVFTLDYDTICHYVG